MRSSQRTGDVVLSAPSPAPSSDLPGEVPTRVFVTMTTGSVILLAFAFGFGNGWHTALLLGVSPWIAWAIQPAVDLAVVGLMVAIRYLAIHGWSDEELAYPQRWLRFFGLLTLAMNTALPLSEHQWGRAAWDGIGPVLLIAWSDLGPWLLRAIYSVRRQYTQPEPVQAVEPTAVEPAVAVTAPAPVQPPAGTSQATVITMPSTVDLRGYIRKYLIDWAADGRTYDDKPAAALFRQLQSVEKAGGPKVPTSKRWIGNLCQGEWDSLYKEGKVGTPRAA